MYLLITEIPIWKKSRQFNSLLPFVYATCFFLFSNPVHAKILFNGYFETGDTSGWSVQYCCEHSKQIVTSPVRAGKYAIRFEQRCDDPKVAGGYRAELQLSQNADLGISIGEEYWYGLSIFVPYGWVTTNWDWLLVAQWHGVPDFDLGESWRSPPLAIQLVGDEWRISNRWDASPVSSGNPSETILWKGSVSNDKETWTDWVIHVKWSWQAEGFLEVWKNGVKVVDRKGPVCYNDRNAPYFKLGVYRSPSQHCPRIVYHDEFRIGDSSSSYEEVAPGQGSPPEPPDNPLIPVSTSNMIANSNNFAADHPVENLWDGCTESTAECTSGAGDITSFWVELDFDHVYDLTSAHLFADAVGEWVSTSWQLQYKEKASDPWTTAFSDVNAFFNDWSTQDLEVKARYVKVTVFGNPDVPATQARELEFYGNPSISPSPPESPRGLHIISHLN